MEKAQQKAATPGGGMPSKYCVEVFLQLPFEGSTHSQRTFTCPPSDYYKHQQSTTRAAGTASVSQSVTRHTKPCKHTHSSTPHARDRAPTPRSLRSERAFRSKASAILAVLMLRRPWRHIIRLRRNSRNSTG